MASIREMISRLLRKKPKGPEVTPRGEAGFPKPAGRVEGHRGLGIGSTTEPDLHPEKWERLSGDQVENFVYHRAVLPVNSTNVAHVQYDIEKHILIVTFLGGGQYSYSNVSEQEAINFAQAGSKGAWVWDRLRIRGSKTGHQKPYRKIR